MLERRRILLTGTDARKAQLVLALVPAAAAMATADASAPSPRLLGQRLLDQTHDDHDDRTANTASGYLSYDRPDIKSAAGSTCNRRNEQAEQLTANAAANNAGD